MCPGKASPRSRRVGHAEIWLRTCQAEESAKMVKRERPGECEDQQRPEQMREESERKQGRGLCEACWIIIRMWDLL